MRRKRTQNGVSTTASLSSVSYGTYRGGTVTDAGTTPGGGGTSGSGASAASGARGSARQVTGGGSAGPTGDRDGASDTGIAEHLSTPATGRSSQDGASGGTVTTSERTSSSSRTGIGASIGTEGVAGGDSRSNRDRYGGGDLGPVANSDELLEDQTHVLLPRRVAENNKQIKVLKERIQGYGKKGLFKKCKFIACEEGLQQVMAKLALIFQIPQQKRQAFTAQFKKTVMDSLNAKRAFCEQQGGKIVLSKYYVLPC